MGRSARIDRSDDRGATLVIVAILMVAIFAMLTLVIDVGGLLAKRRSMVQAADAAALAAAESCAVGSGTPLYPGGPAAGTPESAADTFAAQNAGGTNSASTNIIPGETVGCESGSSGHVTVQYTAAQQIFFGPVIGTSSSQNVVGKATAEWVAGGSTNPMPFVISASAFQSGGQCEVPNIPIDTTCHFWEDNDKFTGSTFGTLDLNKWDVKAASECSGANNDKGTNQTYAGAGGYNGSFSTFPLNYPNPTWVCSFDGRGEGPWYGSGGIGNPALIGQLLTFPIVSDTQYLLQTNSIAGFDVLGFATMKLVQVLPANQSGTGGTGPQPCQYTVAPSFTGLLDLDSEIGVGQAGTCPNTSSNVDFMSVPTLAGCQSNGNCIEGTDYTYDPVNHVIAFLGGSRAGNVTIDFTWQNYGICGAPPTNSSGDCLILQWEGVQLGNAPGGQNFGLVDTRLCDTTISKSCKSLG